MRKVCSLVLVLCLGVGMLAGCSTEEGEKLNHENPQEQQMEEELVIADDFDPETNQKKSIKGFSYEIPESWEEGDSTDTNFYFYPEEGMLMVSYEEAEGVSITDEEFREIYSKNVSSGFEEYELIDEYEIEVAGQEAYYEEIDFTTSSQKFRGRFVTFDYSDGLISFMMGTYFESDVSYDQDFEKIINSIKNEGGATEKQQTNNIESEQQETENISEKAEEPKVTIYSNGMYKIGTDMPAGEYLLTSSSGYYEVTSDSTGSFESIITNDNYTNRAYVTVFEGQYFQFDGSAIPVSEAAVFNAGNGVYPEGMYLVGKDIPAGEYKIVPSGSGYYEVTSDSTGSFESIITNDNFDGDIYITVENGQYLSLSRAKIII